jgi:hypothetical protein
LFIRCINQSNYSISCVSKHIQTKNETKTSIYSVVRLLYFPELNVRSTAVYVAGRMYKRLDTFQKIGLPVFLARLKDTTWDLQLRLQVARILGYTRLGYQIETKVTT